MQSNSSRSPQRQSHFSFSLPPAPRKRPRSPPLRFFQPHQDNSESDSDDIHRKSDPPDRFHIVKNQSFTESQPQQLAIEHILYPVQQHYHRLRHSRRIQKRKLRPNFPPQTLSSPKPKPRSNASQSAQRKSLQPQNTIWDQLADASFKLHHISRKDPRFFPAQRPLDLLSQLQPSIAVTLFPDGYVRHDWTLFQTTAIMEIADLPTSSSRPDVALKNRTIVSTLQRLPYDRNSRDFLKCLDLGILPPSEDLPAQSKSYYYDGCLIAEITDLRAPVMSLKNTERVILRRDSSSLYQDINELTATLHPDLAKKVEQRIVALTAGPIDLSRFPCSTARFANVRGLVHTFNITRLPKKRRISPQPRFMTNLRERNHDFMSSAWLLTTLAHRQQLMCQNAALTLRLASGDNALAAGSRPDGFGISGLPNVSAGGRVDTKLAVVKGSPKLRTGVTSNVLKGSSKKVRMPPTTLLPSSSQTLVAGTSNASSASQRPFVHEVQRLRILNLIQPSRTMSQILHTAQLAVKHGVAGAIERAKSVRNKMKSDPENKLGRPTCVAELLQHPDGSVEVQFTRGCLGEHERDKFRVSLWSAGEGQLFMDQFRKLSETGGYFCLYDGPGNNINSVLQQQQVDQQDSVQGQQVPHENQRQQQFLSRPTQQLQQPQQTQQTQQPQQPQQPTQLSQLPQQPQTHNFPRPDVLQNQQISGQPHQPQRSQGSIISDSTRIQSHLPEPFSASVNLDQRLSQTNPVSFGFSQPIQMNQSTSQTSSQLFSMTPQPSTPLPMSSASAQLQHEPLLQPQGLAEQQQHAMPPYGVHQSSLQLQQRQMSQLHSKRSTPAHIRPHSQGQNPAIGTIPEDLRPLASSSPEKGSVRNGVHVSQAMGLSRAAHTQTILAHGSRQMQQTDKLMSLDRNPSSDQQLTRADLNIVSAQDQARQLQGVGNIGTSALQIGSLSQAEKELLRQQMAKQQQLEQLRQQQHDRMTLQQQQQLQEQLQRHDKNTSSVGNGNSSNPILLMNGSSYPRGSGSNGFAMPVRQGDYGLTRVGNGSALPDAAVMGSMGIMGPLGTFGGLSGMGSMVGFGAHGNGPVGANIFSNSLNHNALLAQHFQQSQAQAQSQQMQPQQIQPSPQLQLHQAQQQQALRNSAQMGLPERQRGMSTGPSMAQGGFAGTSVGVAGIGVYPSQAAIMQQHQALAAVLGSSTNTSSLRAFPNNSTGGVADGTSDLLSHAHLSAQFNAQRENVDASSRPGRQR